MSDETLFLDNEDRYSRLRLIAWWDQEKLTAARFLVVGAGALGNEVLKNLALLGVGAVFVVDFDEIEQSNLTRSVLFRRRDCGRPKAEAAAAALRDLNPDTRVKSMPVNIITDVGLGLFRDVDVVIGCLDNREARLWVNRQCWKANTPWVDGGIQEINGVAKVFRPPDGACYECAMTENDYRMINLRYSCPLLRQEDLQAGKVPTAPTISSMIGALQTQEAIKLIHGLPTADGAALVFNGAANQFYQTKFQHREDCLSHETYPTPIESELSAANTAAELFAAARQHFAALPDAASANAAPIRVGPDQKLALSLDRDLVTALTCVDCGHRQSVMRPLQAVGMAEASCPNCDATMKPELHHIIQEGSELAEQNLQSLGVPAYDIVRVSLDHHEAFFLLAGDRQQVMEDSLSSG